MNTDILKKHSALLKLYVPAFIALIVAVVKYFITPPSVSGYFYMLESVTFILFILAIYLIDNLYRKTNNSLSATAAEFKNATADWENQKRELQEKLSAYEEKENASQKFASYQEKVMLKLFRNDIKKGDKHHLLHLISEVFQAGALVLYKETEPKDHFIVEQSYALPEDFIPAPFVAGEGLNGQAVSDGVPMLVVGLPENYFQITSGLGASSKGYLYLLPVMKNGECKYLLEMITFHNSEIEKMWGVVSEKLINKGIL